MKKTKKLLSVISITLLSVSTLMTLTSCGGTSYKNTTNTKDEYIKQTVNEKLTLFDSAFKYELESKINIIYGDDSGTWIIEYVTYSGTYLQKEDNNSTYILATQKAKLRYKISGYSKEKYKNLIYETYIKSGLFKDISAKIANGWTITTKNEGTIEVKLNFDDYTLESPFTINENRIEGK